MGHTKSAVIALIFSCLVAFTIVFAATQSLNPDANGPTVADGGTGRWTTYGTGSSAWNRLQNGTFDSGVRESTVNDTCNFDFGTFTLPAGAVVSQVVFNVYACLTSGTSATMRVDVSDGTSVSNGTATALSAPEVSECDVAAIVETKSLAPDGGAWDQTDIDNLRVRFILTAASGAGTASVAEMQAVVTYTVPPALGRGLNSIGSSASGQGWLHHQTIKTRLH